METTNKSWVAYLRVSTDDKGQTTTQQLTAIREAAEREGATIINLDTISEYSDEKSGKLMPEDREGLRKAMKLARREKAAIVCAKHDRLARSYSVAEFLAGDSSIRFRFLNASESALYDPTQRMIYFGFMSEGQRNAIKAATGMKMQEIKKAIARANDLYNIEGKTQEEIILLEPDAKKTILSGKYEPGKWRLGTPTAPTNKKEAAAGRTKKANENKFSRAAWSDLSEWLKTNPKNYSAAAKYLNAIGRSTPRGGDYTAQAVKNLIARFERKNAI